MFERAKTLPLTPNHTILEISDEFLQSSKIVGKDSKFTRINVKKMLEISVKVSDIRQRKIGDCYFLSTLGTIFEQDPHFHNKLIKVIDKGKYKGKLAVTLHVTHDLSKTITYVIDPSIIDNKNKMNDHKHPAVFILEKVYALNRAINEKRRYSDEEQVIIDALEKYKNDDKFDFNRTFAELSSDEKKFTFGGKKITVDIIKHVEKKYSANYQDYISALQTGFSSHVYQTLLGVNTKSYAIDRDINTEYLLEKFISDIAFGKANTNFLISKNKTTNVLANIFGNSNSIEAQYFINLIDFNTYNKGATLLAKLKMRNTSEKKKESNHAILRKFFNEQIEWPNEPDVAKQELQQRIKEKIFTFIDREVPYKRGLKQYTEKQEAIFNLIKQKLNEGQLLTVDTHENVGRNTNTNPFSTSEKTSKGLAHNHSYQVMGVVELKDKDNKIIKCVKVRNPWGPILTRGYRQKKLVLDGKPVTVLSAFSQSNTNSIFSFFKRLNPFRPRNVLSSLPVTSSLLNNSRMKKSNNNEEFLIEITELTKRFDAIHYTDSQNAPLNSRFTANNEHLIRYLNTITAIFVESQGDINKSLSTINLAIQSLDKVPLEKDKYAALAFAYHLIGQKNRSQMCLQKLGKDWNLTEAFNHLKVNFGSEITAFASLDCIDNVIAFAKPVEQAKDNQSIRHWAR